MAEPIYDDAEVEEILRSALERGGQTDGLTHAELAEVAAEVGLSTEELEQAARGVLAARAERREREEAQRVLAVRKRQRRRGFAQHVLTWGVVGAGLAALDQLTGAGISWALYPIVGWGIGVGLHGVGLIFADDEKEIRQIARQLRKQRERAAREAARNKEKKEKRPKVTAEAALEHALEKGIALLLTKVAEKLEAAAAPPP
ncbi:MAG: 2TM domain-containing protein, partial [Myxococcales bacterium]|nr:2TM domain-containing protein [Myxococcales bacterium]